MSTFSFTSVAGVKVRRAVGVLAVVFATSAMAYAGGHGPSLGSSGSGSFGSNKSNLFAANNSNQSNNNSNRQLDLHKTTNLNSNSNSNNTQTNNTVKNDKPIDLQKLGNINDNNQVNNKLDKNITNKLDLHKIVADGGSNGMKNKLKLDNMDKKQFKDFCKEKCVHDCFHCCPWWYCWDYPCWSPLYSCDCGYWYDVPVVEIQEGVDLQLLAVRMIDAGDADQGPAYRVWVRNNSRVTITHPFNVLLLAAHDATPAADLPQAGVRVTDIGAGQVLPVDIRLPATANQPGLPMLHVLVDSHREIAEVHEDNNGTIVKRADVLPIDAPETATGTPIAAE